MLSIAVTLFLAGVLTILLPCILPLIPIVLGVSIAGKNRWRPLVTIAGMVVSFVGFTFLLQVVLSQFVELANVVRIATYYLLLLFGFGFLTHNKYVLYGGAALGALFFLDRGWPAVAIAAVIGVAAMAVGGNIAGRIQQIGAGVQAKARAELGGNVLLTAFIVGLTLGLVWAPCAGPALSFALTLVRDKPGLEAFVLLMSYGLGAAVPLLAIGYGGQAAVHSVRAISRYSGVIKQVSGAILILSALAFRFDAFTALQTFLVSHTDYGAFATHLEEALFQGHGNAPMPVTGATGSGATQGKLPVLAPAPEFAGLGPWHNSQPLTLQGLKGKVVLVDFWTYSCINCIRTLPYIESLWEKYKAQPFVLLGVHTPEFTFEHVEKNVSDAIKEHGLTYPVAQDNDFSTWNAFQNQYWPAKYLIDAKGNIRYVHFGEGGYEETDQAVASLLKEMGITAQGPAIVDKSTATNRPRTAETYLGGRSWVSFSNGPASPVYDPKTYAAPASLDADKYALVGTWQLTGTDAEKGEGTEREVLLGDSGEIRLRFTGMEANLVLGLEDGMTPVKADIELDGKPSKSLTIQAHDLYNLFTGAYGEHTLTLRLHGKGVAAYAFTFGS